MLQIIVWVLGITGAIASIYCAAVIICDRFGFYSWVGVRLRVQRLVDQVRDAEYNPDLVIGVGRSGAVVGGMLAGNLGVKPIGLVDRLYTWDKANARHVTILPFIGKEHIQSKRVLLVDAAPHTGETCKEARDYVARCSPDEVRIACLFVTPYCIIRPHYFAGKVKAVRKMPWRFSKDYREDFSANGGVKRGRG